MARLTIALGILASCAISISCNRSILVKTRWRTTAFSALDTFPELGERRVEIGGILEGLNNSQWYREFSGRLAEMEADDGDYVVFLNYSSGVVGLSAMIGHSNHWRRVVLEYSDMLRSRTSTSVVVYSMSPEEAAEVWRLCDELRWRRRNSCTVLPAKDTCAPTVFLRIARGRVMRFHCVDGEIPEEYWRLEAALRKSREAHEGKRGASGQATIANTSETESGPSARKKTDTF